MSTVDHMNAIADRATAKPPRLRRREVVLDDGHRVGLSLCGEGVPLVLVHGIMAEGMLYARSLRRLAGLGFRVIAVDTASHGRTGGLGVRGLRWSAYVDLHERVLDHLGLEKAVLMGHSMGGRIVVDVAARNPDRVLAVVPINAAIGAGFDRFTKLSRFVPGLLPLGLGLLAVDIGATLVRGRRQMGSLARLAAPSLLDRARTLPALPAAFVATIGDQGSADRLRELHRHHVPTVVVHSTGDLAVWYPFAKSAARDAGATFVTLPGAQHSWMIEHPDSLPALVADLLEGSLGAAIETRGADGIDAMWADGAVGLDLDAPRSQPYRLRARHRWVIDPPADGRGAATADIDATEPAASGGVRS